MRRFKLRSIRRFVITEKAPTRAFSWLKAATTAFTFKTLLRHYAKRTLTPRSLNVKLGPRRNYHKGWTALGHYANQPRPTRGLLRDCTTSPINRFAALHYTISHCTGPLTAPAVLSAYPPAPTSGLSPTRPGSLPVIPPVEVAQARLPAWSQHNSGF